VSVSWPKKPPVWLEDWVLWRMEGSDMRYRPADAPEAIPSWCWNVVKFVQWRANGGRPEQRPINQPVSIPQAYWPLAVNVIKRRRQHTFSTQLSVLQRQTLYVAWGLENGQYDPRSLMGKAKQYGYEAVALQITSHNMALFKEVQAVGRDVGILTGLWEWAQDPHRAALAIDGAGAPDFFDANIEHLGDWQSYFRILRDEFPYLPMATSTNFWGFITPENQTTFDGAASYAVALGVACRPEAYLADSNNLTPDRLHYTARRLGWPHEMILPIVSLYAGPNGKYGVRDYDLEPYAGWGAYTAEYL